MNYHYIKDEIKNRIEIITLNRPEVRNALSMALLTELADALRKADANEDVEIIILTGEGKAFSAGIDLNDLESFNKTEKTPGFTNLFAGEEAFYAARSMKKPIICAVNGYAITGGFEIVLSCDIIIASENARFADTHAKVGIVPGAGMTQILPRLIGTAKAKDMSFTGEFMSAAEALSSGLVSRVVPHDKLLDAAIEIAEKIKATNRAALLKIKQTIDRGNAKTLEEGMKIEAEDFHAWREQFRPKDAEEAIRKMTKKGK